MITDPLERLWPYPKHLRKNGELSTPERIRFTGECLPRWLVDDFQKNPNIRVVDELDAYPVDLALNPELGNEEYKLTVKGDGACVVARDSVGLSYAMRTLEQLFAYFPTRMPELVIEDKPTFRKRCFMVDMGRAVWRLPLLKRMVRILHRLKMNQLHLHLYDDELCSIIFDELPFGTENPYALTLDEYEELVDYATSYHVEIVPELEAWGHAGSIVYHRPELKGGKGMFHGNSFLICEETFELIRQMVRQIAARMPDTATIHLGLDEAEWYMGREMPCDFSPADMVRRYYDIVKEVGDELNKKLTMRIWADHTGRPIPDDIKDDIIIEPWCYWNALQDKMTADIEKYSGDDKPAWMAGAGVSGGQYRGAYHATRFWAKNTCFSPNIEGINITFWCWNDIDEKLISLFAGAYYLWNSDVKTSFAELTDYEAYDRVVFPIMYGWQTLFNDADPDAIRQDRGAKVYLGHYHFGSMHQQPVAPTAPLAGSLTAAGHDYLNEHKVMRKSAI